MREIYFLGSKLKRWSKLILVEIKKICEQLVKVINFLKMISWFKFLLFNLKIFREKQKEFIINKTNPQQFKL